MSSKTRILEYLEFKGISKNQFYRDTGLSNGFLDKTNNIGSDKLKIIISTYLDLNLVWVITGVGEMLHKNDRRDNNDLIPNVHSNLYKENVKENVKKHVKVFPNVQDKLCINEPEEQYVISCKSCAEKEQIINALQTALNSQNQTIQVQTQLIEQLRQQISATKNNGDKKESNVA